MHVNFGDFRQLKTHRKAARLAPPRSLSVTMSNPAKIHILSHICHLLFSLCDHYVCERALSWVVKATLGPTLFFIYFDVNEWAVRRRRD